MSYIKTTWVTGDIVTAPRMNNMENGIYNNDAAITALQSEVTDTEADITTLQTNVASLQTNVTNLQTTTNNLIPSIANTFSTSSTYAVGDHVMYNGRLYECKTAITTAGAWNTSSWQAVSIYKYDDLVGVIKITSTSTTMATVETTLSAVNTAGDHVVFDVSALSSGMRLCTIYLNDGQYRITDIATGFNGEGLYSSTDTLASILQKGSEPFYITDTTPYTFRETPSAAKLGKAFMDKLIGGSLGWNQLVKELNSTNWTNENGTTTSFVDGVATFTSTIDNNGIGIQYSLSTFVNHKYLLCMNVKSSTAYTGLSFGIPGSGQPIIRFKDSIGGDTAWHTIEGIRECTSSNNLKRIYIFRTSGTVENLSVRNVMFLDLTQMFGSTIADYVYGLESATAGSGIAWLRKYIDLGTYHAYDAGSIQSVEATAHVTTGKNYFNPTVGKYTNRDGTITTTSNSNWCVDKFFSIGNATTITGKIYDNSSGYTGSCGCIFFDSTMTFISYTNFFTASNITSYPFTKTLTVPSGTKYFGISGYQAGGASNILNAPIQIELGSTATAYEPYTEHVYSLGSDTLRGIPQLVNNELSYDGDEKLSDGTINRKYGIVDLGTLNYTYNATYGFYATMPSNAVGTIVDGADGICGRYVMFKGSAANFSAQDKAFTSCNANLSAAKRVYIKDSAYSDAAAFKTAMSGVYLVYPLATPTTEQGTAYQRIQTVDADGTEEFVTNTPVPVGHETQYPQNLLAIAEQIDEAMPTAPSTDGTYTLQAVVSNGVPSYQWVSGQTVSSLSTTSSQRATASLLNTGISVNNKELEEIDGLTTDGDLTGDMMQSLKDTVEARPLEAETSDSTDETNDIDEADETGETDETEQETE